MLRFIRILILIIALLLLTVSLLGLVPLSIWFLDIFNHFRVQYLIISATGLVITLLLRSMKPRKLALIIFSIALSVNAFFIAPLFIPNQVRKSPSERVLAIVSYNSWIRNDDWAAVSEVFQHSPDIVYFTEMHESIRTNLRRLAPTYHLFESETEMLLVRRDADINPQRIRDASINRVNGVPITFSIEDIEVILLAIHPSAPLNESSSNSRDEAFDSITDYHTTRQKTDLH